MIKNYLYILFFLFYFEPIQLKNIDTIDIQAKEYDPNSLYIGVKSILDGLNQLLIEENPIAGINYLLDGISNFISDYSNENELDNSLKNELYELIIKFKYQITVVINTYFKLYEEDSRFEITTYQKLKISDKIKSIFSNTLNILDNPSNSNFYLKEMFYCIFDVLAIIFSVNTLIEHNIKVKSFTPIKEVLVTHKALIEKLECLKIKHIKRNNIKETEIKENLIKLFNGIINLAMDSNINFINFKEAICGLLKVIGSIFLENTKTTCN